jgi:hypothetical protein
VTDRHTIIAFLATLASIVTLVITGAVMAANGRPAEALGIGGAVTGLIGVIGTFKPRTTSSDQPQDVNVVNDPKQPVPTRDAK